MPRASPEAIQRNRVVTRERRRENRLRIAAYKIRLQCADCPPGQVWPSCVLQLDHRPGEMKIGEVSKMVGANWEKIAAEIAKCDCVCANHHAIRTQSRRDSQ